MAQRTMLFTLCLAVIGLHITGIESSATERKLQELLFANYSKNVRPVENVNDVLKLEVSFQLLMIRDVDEKNQLVTLTGLFTTKWNDYLLKWDPIDHDGIHEMIIPDDLVWTPRIAQLSSATGDPFIPLPGLVSVSNNGTVETHSSTSITFPCSMAIRLFPFDTQTCSEKVAPWLYDDKYVTTDSTIKDITRDLTFINTEWQILSGSAQPVTFHTDYPPKGWSLVVLTLTFKRRPLYYVTNILLPCMLMAILTQLVYLLPCDCGEKMSFSVSVLISISVFSLLVGDIMPPTSETVPLITRYLLFNTALVACSIVSATFALRFHHRPPKELEMGRWIRILFIDILPTLLMMKKWKKATRVGQENLAVKSLFVPSKHSLNITDVDAEGNDIEDKGKGNSLDVKFEVNTPKCEAFRQEIKHLMLKRDADEVSEKMLEEWKYAATVVDRLLLWISLISYIIGTFVMFSEVTV